MKSKAEPSAVRECDCYSSALPIWPMGSTGSKKLQFRAGQVSASTMAEAVGVPNWEEKVVFLGNGTLLENILYSVFSFLVMLYLFMADLKEWKNNI